MTNICTAYNSSISYFNSNDPIWVCQVWKWNNLINSYRKQEEDAHDEFGKWNTHRVDEFAWQRKGVIVLFGGVNLQNVKQKNADA